MEPLIAQLLSAFLVGLLGGVHCVGMCGGIAGALSLGVTPARRERLTALLPLLGGYNAGRLVSYSLAGAIAGGLGSAAVEVGALDAGRALLSAVAGLFMVAMGLYLAGWWFGVARLERVGGVVWRRVEPFARRLLPVRSAGHALLLGLVWGWLPCGLVYSVLIWSLSAGGAPEGALLMLAFGLGTLPTLLATGLAAARLGALIRRPWIRHTAGTLVIGFGLWMLLGPVLSR